MPCIPIIKWERQDGGVTRFDGFRVEAETEIRKRLARDLKPFRLDDAFPAVLRLCVAASGGLKPTGYRLEAGPGFVSVTSPTVCGLHHGLACLKLLLASQNGRLSHGEALINPDFEHRGVMLDVSRGKMASLEYLKQLVSFLSDIGYNVFQLYCEDKLALKKHPLVGSATGAYTESQIRELDAWCGDCFVELQPCIQTFSHLQGLLCLPGYCRLCENEEMFTLAPGKDEVYTFLDDELGETLPWFTSTTLNINMDEAYDIGTGYSRRECEHRGQGEVFLSHLRRVVAIARGHGAKTIIMWGDFAAKHHSLLSGLPEGVVLADWNYNPDTSYPSVDVIRNIGVPFWVAGGVSSWNSLFPRVYNSYMNLINLSAEAFAKGAGGFLVTDWGDYGHMQPLGLSLYGYMVGAQQAFHARETDPRTLEEEAWPLIFPDRRTEAAFRLLMDSNLAPNLQNGFKTMSLYFFFDDLLSGLSLKGNDRYLKLTRESFSILEEKGRAAYRLLCEALADGTVAGSRFPDENWEALFGTAFLKELRLSARMTGFTGRKGGLSFDILDHLRSADCSEDALLILINRIRGLYTEFLSIRREFERVWVLRAYEKGIESALSLFDKAGVQLGETVKWLAAQRAQLIRGGQIDTGLETYEAGKQYRILWTSDFRNLWDRAYPWQ